MEHPMKFACLLKWRRDLNEVISGLNEVITNNWLSGTAPTASWPHPTHYTSHTDHKQLSLVGMGHFKPHTREGHRCTKEDSSSEQTAATGKVPLTTSSWVSERFLRKAMTEQWLRELLTSSNTLLQRGKRQSRLALNLHNKNGKPDL